MLAVALMAGTALVFAGCNKTPVEPVVEDENLVVEDVVTPVEEFEVTSGMVEEAQLGEDVETVVVEEPVVIEQPVEIVPVETVTE